MAAFPGILPSLLSSALILVLFVTIWDKRQLAVVKALYALLASIFIWVFFRFLIILQDQYAVKLFLSKLQYSGIAFTGVTWLIFTLVATKQTKYLNHKTILLFSVIPAITFLLALTNEYHHLIWENIEFSGIAVQAEHGKWFVVHIVYSWLLIGIATVLATVQYFRYRKKRSEFIAIIIAPLLVTLTNVNRIMGWVDMGELDTVSIAFTFSVVMFSWVVIKNNYLYMAPVALRAMVKNMQDAIIILDDELFIVDMNPAAEKLFAVKNTDIIARHISELFADNKICREVIEHSATELTINETKLQALTTRYPVRLSRADGVLIVLRDITTLKNTQHMLEQAQKELLAANEELKILANTDALTGLANRRYFLEMLKLEMARVERYDSKLCVMLLDLDFFKKINDSYGHPAGDAVLKRVAAIIKNNARKNDITGRLGGEEFGLILPDTDLAGATVYAERLRNMIANNYDESDIPVTASIGLVSVKKGMQTEDILKHADNALYQSKEAGRNRVSVSE